jgi:hypothetical protein
MWTILAVIGLLVLHYALAARSLLRENPTVDEVAHLPAGITYWQKGTFRLYHHNPPLFKLVAALPVVMARPAMEELYITKSWRSPSPSQATFSQWFALFNAGRYFELFQIARLMMPLFTVIGGVVVFAWSARLFGRWGGLLSLALWAFCPNILAHARLVTSDACSTVMGVAATYAFWGYLREPTWKRAALAGVLLGVAQLSKFSMLLLYAVWPLLWLSHLAMVGPGEGAGDRRSQGTLRIIARGLLHGLAIVALSVLTIDAGYFFEGVGIPLDRFEFGSRTLTRPVPPGMARPHSENELLEATWQFRINRFRGTWLGALPMPLPEHYLLGFDEQKIETEGVPPRYFLAARTGSADRIDAERRSPQTAQERTKGYTVYLDGELRNTGWLTYYPRALLYKVPEGTWLLVALSLIALAARRSSSAWFDEVALWAVPSVILVSMSLFTDINLGLRYVLAIFPYVFIATGKVVPWCQGLRQPWCRVTGSIVGGSLALTVVASLWIQPSYLSYFNWASGGPDREPVRLIDSNLDWGQDLVELQRWWRKNIPDQEIGLAYFGQINPSIFALRGEPFRWFLPPIPPDAIAPMVKSPTSKLIGLAPRLEPGYYAVSATLLYGLPWRLYDPASPLVEPLAVQPAWNVFKPGAFNYFRRFRPITTIGHSIYVYRLTEEDVAPVDSRREEPAAADHDSRSHRLSTDIDLRQVIFAHRPKEDVDLESRPPQSLWKIVPELGEDRIAPVTAGMGDPRRAILDAPIGPDDHAREGPLRSGQDGHGEDVTPAGHQHAQDLAERGIQVGHMLQGLGSEHQVEAGVGIGQTRQVFRPDSIDHRAGCGSGPVIGRREVRHAAEAFEQPIDAVNLGDAHRLSFWRLDPAGQRVRRDGRRPDGIERQHGLSEATATELGPAGGAIAGLFPRQGLGQPRREPPQLLEPARDHATAIQHRPESAADRAVLEAAMSEGIEVIAREPSEMMGRVPAGEDQPLEPGGNRTGHGSRRPQSRRWRVLRDGEFREGTHRRRLEGQHDAVLRDSGLEQFGGHPMLQSVALDPQLPVDDIDVDEAAVDTLLLVPTDVHQDIPIAGPVEDGLGLDVPVGVGNLGVLDQDRFDDRANII